MGKVVPTSLSSGLNLQTSKNSPDENSRKESAASNQFLPNQEQNSKEESRQEHSESFVHIMGAVDHINHLLQKHSKDLLVLINKNDESYKILVIDVNTDTIIKEFEVDEFMEMAQNLRNQNVSFLNKDV